MSPDLHDEAGATFQENCFACGPEKCAGLRLKFDEDDVGGVRAISPPIRGSRLFGHG